MVAIHKMVKDWKKWEARWQTETKNKKVYIRVDGWKKWRRAYGKISNGKHFYSKRLGSKKNYNFPLHLLEIYCSFINVTVPVLRSYTTRHHDLHWKTKIVKVGSSLYYPLSFLTLSIAFSPFSLSSLLTLSLCLSPILVNYFIESSRWNNENTYTLHFRVHCV